MVVQAQVSNPAQPWVVGLNVGAVNAHQFFPSHLRSVELTLDHLVIVCDLHPSFWNGSPVIQDLRLSSWLEAKLSSGKLESKSASIALVPCGDGAFRLEMISEEGADYSPINATVVSSARAIEVPIPKNPPLKFGPRRVGRLRDDEVRPVAANY